MFFALSLNAAWQEPEPEISTQPIGSPYYRHLAQDMNQDLRQLVKFEKKGFGRSEIVALIIISSTTGKPLKGYGNRRLKDKVTLQQLADEAHIDYAQLMTESKRVKELIEAKGDKNLPPALYEMGEILPTPSPTPLSKKDAKKQKKEQKKKEQLEKKQEKPAEPEKSQESEIF